MVMSNFRDLAAFKHVLEVGYQQVPGPAIQPVFVKVFVDWGYSSEQAELYSSVIFSKNDAGSAERAVQYVNELTGRWVNGSMQNSGLDYVKTSKETWEFRDDLTYTHKYETYEGMSMTGVYMQSSYSKPSSNAERGIWAPGDARDRDGNLSIVTISESGFTRQLAQAWTDGAAYYHQGLTLNGEKFGREL